MVTKLPSRIAHGVEIRIVSLSEDGSHSLVRISTGLNKFVRDLTEKVRIHEDNENTSGSAGESVAQESKLMQIFQMSAGKPAAKARPKQKSASFSSSSSTGIPIHLRKWVDVEPSDQQY